MRCLITVGLCVFVIIYCGAELLEGDRVVLPAKWSTLRPEQIKPAQFLELTLDMYGRRGSEVSQRVMRAEQIKTDKKAQAKAGSAGALKRAAASVDSTVNDPETSRQLVDVQSAVELYPEKVGRGEGGALPTGTRLATLLRQRSLWGTTTTTTAAGDGGAMKGGEKITEAPVGVKNATDEVKQLPVVEYKVDAVWRKTFTYAI